MTFEQMREPGHLQLAEHAPDGIFVIDRDGRHIYTNPAACRLLGYAREELIAKTIMELLPPEDLERLQRTQQVLAGGAVQVAEWRLRKSDGSFLPVEISARLLPDGQWLGFVRDMSERKRIENALRASEARALGILAISADALISIDCDLRITMFNQGAEKIFGYGKAEAIGAPVDMLIPERFRAAHRMHVARFTASTESARRMGDRSTAIYGVRKNGEEFPADASISKIAVNGTLSLTIALRDITEQRSFERHQQFLAESGVALGASLDYEATLSVVAQLVVRDLADFCVVDIVEENGDVCRLKVASKDPSRAWVSEKLASVQLERSRPHLFYGALEQQRPVLRAYLTDDELGRLAQNDEHLRALQAAAPRSVIAVPLTAHGTLVGAIGLVSSTSIYGPAELQLAKDLAHRAALAIDNARHYRASRRATQARDDVLGIVAHDLRNPLGVIGMNADVLLVSATEHKPEIDQIVRNVRRMSRMLKDLLDVTRLDAGQLSLDRASVPAPQIVSDVADAQRPLIAAAAVDLRCDVAPDVPDVLADRDRLLQIFENLVGNALKFTPPGGCITLGAKPHGSLVEFWVSDTGLGIAREDQQHLFDRFWQGDGPRRRGAGLGLSIVEGLVEAHGGRIWVESAPDRGSTFYFTIPVGPAVTASSRRTRPTHLE